MKHIGSDIGSDEAKRLGELLRVAIRIADVPSLEIERRLGWSRGYLSRLLRGSIELRLRHVVNIAAAIGLEPAEFFHLAYPKTPQFESPAAQRVLDLFRRIPGAPSPATAPAGEQRRTGQENVDEMVREALRRVMAELGRASG